MIVCIANQKGGVGKTTLTVHLGAYLSHHGQRVTVIDADPQGNATQWIVPTGAPFNGLAQALLPPHPVITSLLMPISGEWNLDLCPGGPDTADTLIYLSAAHKPFVTISDTLQPLRDTDMIVLIDMPPSRAAGFKELLFASDYLIVPTQLERASLVGVSLTHQTTLEIQAKHGHAPQLLAIIPNMAKHRIEHHNRLDELTNAFGSVVWPPVPDAIAVAEANGFSEPLFTYDPRAKVTLAMITIGQRFMQNTGLIQ